MVPEKTLIRISNLEQTERTLTDAFDLVRQFPEEEREKALIWNCWVRDQARRIPSNEMYNLLFRTYLFGAQNGIFDDYCIALEWEREPQKRFYLPCRSVRKPLVDDLQDLYDGKLVEQRPEEGTGEELYRQIQAEKQWLIKEGKIKKEKPLTEIAEGEIPFDIPESWKWVRLPEIGTSSLGKTLNKGLDTGNEVPYLCSINVYWDGVNLNQIKTAKFSGADMEKYLLRRGDLLTCEGRDVGRSAVWDRDMEMYYQNALHCVRLFGQINPYYFKYCFELYKHYRILENASKGMTIKHLVQGSLYAILFPLPPLAEQKRIVAKLEEILPLCERLK